MRTQASSNRIKSSSAILSFVILYLMLFAGTSCSESAEQKKDQSVQKNPEDVKPDWVVNDSINRFYRILTGIDEDSAVQGGNMAQQWNNMQSRLLDPIATWKQTDLPEACRNTSFVFYPFSGPDFIIPNALFPGMKHMIMFGLEAPGNDISHRGTNYAQTVLPKMKMALRDYFGKNYFITGNMIKDLKSDSIRGVTPLISTFITRSGFSIISIKNFVLDSSGSKMYTANANPIEDKIPGVEIRYTRDGKSDCMIDYLAFNAENHAMQKHSEILQFFDKNVPDQTCTYFKSASYLMHYQGFSMVRDFCLKKSNYILEDDTGIPYKYLADQFDVKLWGIYEMPIRDFSGVFQSDLDSFYRSRKDVGQLPFSMGYHYNNNHQNLMLATKKTAQ
jgi:hypothetical protein